MSKSDDTISRQMAIEAFEPTHYKDWYTPTIIETLETLPSVRPEVLACGNGELVEESDGLVNDLVKDCISRKMAIDAVAKWFYDVFGIKESDGTATIFKRLRELPSAQSEQPEIIRCKDCKYRDDDDFCIGRGYPNSLVPDDGFCDKGERSE